MLRQRSAHEEDFEVSAACGTVREAAQGAACSARCMLNVRNEHAQWARGERREGGGLWRISTTAAGGGAHLRDISKKEDALIVIESELDMLLRAQI